MTDIQGPKFTDRNFISHDGTDSNGHRAEVYVEKNRGKILEINANEKNGTADVRFQVEGYQHPMHGWIRLDEAAYEEAVRAKDADEEVNFRIELQRKKSVDRHIPIMEIRERQRDRDRPGIKLLVAVNGIETSEGLTNPNEDPVGLNGAARRATDEDRGVTSAPATAGGTTVDPETLLSNLRKLANEQNASQAIMDAAVGQAVAHGVALADALAAVTPEARRDDSQPPQQSYHATEAPSWKLYNSDGRLNLGSYAVASAVGAENLAYQQFASAGALKASNAFEALNYFTNVILGLADRAQVVVQGEGAHADRSVQSHTRIRGILYTLIEHEYALPIEVDGDRVVVVGGNDAMKSWMQSVGGATVRRFKAAVEASLSTPRYALPESLGGAVSAPTSAPTPASAPAPVEASTATAPVASAPSPVETPAEPIQVASDSSKEDRMAAARAILEQPLPPREEEETFPADVANGSNVANGLVFAPVDVSNSTEAKAGAEAQEEFKEMLSGNGFDITDRADQLRAASILRYTFGVPKVAEVPEGILYEFIDHYVTTGPEGLQAAAEAAAEGN